MKQTLLNKILTGVICVLSLSICVLIVCIATRPRYVDTTEPETAIITEVPALNTTSISQNEQTATVDTPPTTIDSEPSIVYGKTSTRVNIRDAASEDARVVETVEEGTTFTILEIQDNGWTKILYNDVESYINSSFVIIVK